MNPLAPSVFNDLHPHYRKDIEAWVNHGVLPPTVFLTALLQGDLKGVVKQASREHMSNLVQLVRFLERVEPDCWGSPNAVGEWLHAGGIVGKAKVLNEYEQAVNKPPTSKR